jgi:hypothetical protein
MSGLVGGAGLGGEVELKQKSPAWARDALNIAAAIMTRFMMPPWVPIGWQAAETGTRFARPDRAVRPLRQGEQVEGAHSWATVHRLSLLSPGLDALTGNLPSTRRAFLAPEQCSPLWSDAGGN